MAPKQGTVSGSVSVSQSGVSPILQKFTPGKSRHNSAERRRKRKERFFRFILRRRPCYIVFFIEIGLAVGFFFAGTALLNQFNTQLGKKAILQKHDEIYAEKKNERTLLHCDYQTNNTYDQFYFNTGECKYRCDSDALIFRAVPLVKKQQDMASCHDKFELFPCSEQMCVTSGESQKGNWTPSSLIETACLGKNHGYMRKHHVAPVTEIKVPKLNLTLENKGQTIFANELFAVCPRCRVRTHWMKKQKLIRCSRNLDTLREGWPWDYRFCNYVERGSCEEVKLDLNQDGEDNY
ncbi:hypothetical protein QR680_016489 [Steinernema hermaphroditum]|uniref:Uncharacterized protein n=1 Tax=Steinernema hermaphroditum TaxID=289476 RepID=A0AA39HBD9_9BILA|nr:hypothetical protein QR680_016489 [Steinernema hermaphroditum]